MIKVILVIVLCAFPSFSFLLSSSEIVKCENTSSGGDQLLNCDTKALLLLSLENSQMAGTETLTISIDNIDNRTLIHPI